MLNNLPQGVVILLTVLFMHPAARGQNNPAEQQPEQLIQKIEHLRGAKDTNEPHEHTYPEKCGLGLWFDMLRNWNAFSISQQHRLTALASIPLRQKSRIIGHFRIFYDTTGSQAPSLIDSNFNQVNGTAEQYVDSAGEFFNHAWNYEIDSLGYPPPPLPSDGKYRVVITDLDPGFYGVTTPDSTTFQGPPLRSTTYIEVDNDFAEFLYGTSRGIPGLKVTAAHEFHHSIQIGNYGIWDADRYFYEITSTWMEDVVYTDVNDYYQYLTNDPTIVPYSQFAHPEQRFTLLDGKIEYSRAIWGKFIEKRFSRALMKRTWEYMRQEPSIKSLDDALTEVGSSFRSAFLEFTYWNFFTGTNADTIRYYSEGKHYPTMFLQPERTYAVPELVIDGNLQAVSSVYQPIRLQGGNMLTMISNINTLDEYSPQFFTFSYSLSGNQTPGSKHLSNGLFSRIINISDPQNWVTQETIPAVVEDVAVYPNPFTPKGNKPLKFHLPQTTQKYATLTIFKSGSSHVFSGDLPVQPFELIMEWDGHDDRGNTVQSGIYIFVINAGDQQYVGKFAVIR